MDVLSNLFLTVAAMSVNALPVLLVLALLRLALKKAPRSYSYALWSVAAFRLLCPVALPSDWSLFNLPFFNQSDPKQAAALAQRAVNAGTSTLRQAAQTARAVTGAAAGGADAAAVSGVPSAPAAPAAPALTWDMAKLAALVWLVGVAAVLAFNGWQLYQLRRRTRTAVRLEGEVWESDQIPGPFVLGLLRPRIFLPTGLDQASRTYVLAHERYHLRRHDPWFKALALLVCALHWFNPAVWLAARAMDRDMELSCDEGALKTLEGDCRQDYSRTLLALGASRRDFGPALAFGTPAVKQRIVHALSFHKAGRATAAAALAVLLLAGLTCCTNAAGGWVDWSGPGETCSYRLPQGVKSLAVYVQETDGEHVLNQDVMAYGDWSASSGQFDLTVTPDESWLRWDWSTAEGVSTQFLSQWTQWEEDAELSFSVPAERVSLTLDQPTELLTVEQSNGGAVTACYTCYLYPSSLSQDETDAKLTGSDYAQRLYEARVQYIGDASAVGALRSVVAERDWYQNCTMELFTGEEPYGLALHFTAPEDWTGSGEELDRAEQEALRSGILLLALIDNADYYEQTLGDTALLRLTVSDAEALLGIDDLKSSGQSVEGVSELLDRISLLEDRQSYAAQLYAARASSATDHPAMGDLWTLIWQGDQYNEGQMLVLDSAQPYGVKTILDRPVGGDVDEAQFQWETWRNGVLFLALAEDVEVYQQILSATASKPEVVYPTITVESAQQKLGVDDLKAWGRSPSGIAQLLDLLDQLREDGTGTDLGLEDDQEHYYLQTDEDPLYAPCLTLWRDTHTFAFSYDILSSYYPSGVWTETDGLIRCETDDGAYHYTFRRADETTLQFVADQSSSVEPISRDFGADITDGDLFVKDTNETSSDLSLPLAVWGDGGDTGASD